MKKGASKNSNATLHRAWLGADPLSPSSKSVMSLRTMVIDTVTCGDKVLRLHKRGHVLASVKVLKPVVLNNTFYKLDGGVLVSAQAQVEYDIRVFKNGHSKLPMLSLGGSLRRMSKRRIPTSNAMSEASAGTAGPNSPRLSSKRYAKSAGRLAIDNNFLHLLKGVKKKGSALTGYSNKTLSKAIKFAWMHLYSIEREKKSNKFSLLFYEGLDEKFVNGKKLTSSTFQIKAVRLKFKDSDDMLSALDQVYVAVRTQVHACASIAKEIGRYVTDKQTQFTRAAAFLRLSIDLCAICEGCESVKTINAIGELIKHLETGNEDEIYSEEIDFWTNRKTDLEDSLREKEEDGDAVAGIAL